MAQQYDSDGDPIDPDSGARFGWSGLSDVRPLRGDGTPMSADEVAQIKAYLETDFDAADVAAGAAALRTKARADLSSQGYTEEQLDALLGTDDA